MKIAIVGTGGVGGYFGAKLAKAGNDVTFIARGAHLKAMQEKGLVVKSINGDFTVENIKATDEISKLNKPDLVLICVKAWQVKDIAKQLALVIDENTTVIPLQNGVVATDELKEFLPVKTVLGGLCRIVSKIEAPGVINHFAVEPVIVFGELDNSKTKRVEEIKNVFDRAGIGARISSDISADLWKKFLLICSSGLIAITKQTYDELRSLKETREMMIELFNEIYQLSQKAGIKIEPDFVDKTIAIVDAYPLGTTSSLTRDVWEGKPSEIEYQNGTVVKLGEKFGVETPVNKFIYRTILPMEIKARSK